MIDILGIKHMVSQEDLHGDWGFIDHSGKYIIIHEKLNNPDTYNSVLLHEILHGVDFVVNAGLNEDQTVALANGLYSVIKNNPKFIKDVLEGRCHARQKSKRNS